MTNPPLPLFDWQTLSEVERLRRDREDLLNRIRKLRPHAHKRVILEDRLQVKTLRQMALEVALERGERP